MPIAAHPQRWLLFDGDCGFCRRWCDWAIRRGAEQTVTFQPCQEAVELRAKAGVHHEQCLRSAVYIEATSAGDIARVRTGAAAINSVLSNLPGSRNLFWRWLTCLYAVPGLQQLEEFGYRFIARNRGRFGRQQCRI